MHATIMLIAHVHVTTLHVTVLLIARVHVTTMTVTHMFNAQMHATTMSVTVLLIVRMHVTTTAVTGVDKLKVCCRQCNTTEDFVGVFRQGGEGTVTCINVKGLNTPWDG